MRRNVILQLSQKSGTSKNVKNCVDFAGQGAPPPGNPELPRTPLQRCKDLSFYESGSSYMLYVVISVHTSLSELWIRLLLLDAFMPFQT